MIGAGVMDRGRITRIAYACGFSSSNQMGKAFKSRYGMSPSQFGYYGDDGHEDR